MQEVGQTSVESMPERSARPEDSIYALLICLIVYAVAVWQIRGYQNGLDRQTIVIPGDSAIPVLSFGARDSWEQPAVIIAHGLSASKEMMQTLGLEVARMGLAAYLFDFPGHGASTAAFHFDFEDDHGEAAARNTDQLVAYLERVYDYVREQHGGNAARIALVGHSMGSGVVMRFAMEHPEVKAVVAIAPPNSGEVSQSLPPNLLLLVGQWDMPRSVAGVREALAAATDGQTEPGTTYGDFSRGTARRAALLPHLDHVAIIFSPATTIEINHWLARTFPVLYVVPTGIVRLLWLLAANLAAIVGGLLLVSPLHHLASRLVGVANPDGPPQVEWDAIEEPSPAVPARESPAEPWRISLGEALGYLALFVLASGLAVLFLNVRTPFTFIKLLVGDYLTSYFFTAGVLMFVITKLTRRDIPLLPGGIPWGGAHEEGFQVSGSTLRFSREGLCSLLVSVALFVLFFLTIGLLGTYTWVRFTPAAGRWPRFIPVFLLSLPFFLVDETIFRALQESTAVGSGVLTLLGKVVVLASLAAGALLSPQHFVVILMLPLMLIFFVLFQLFSLRVYHVTRSSLATATLNALLVAWIIVAIFPIT